MAKVVIFTKTGCTDCEEVKQFIARQGFAYEEREISSNIVHRDFVRKVLKTNRVPVVLAGYRFVVGKDFPKIRALLRTYKDRLERLG